jgi:hypothetical protein
MESEISRTKSATKQSHFPMPEDEVIDITPNWVFATSIYIMVLENPEASKTAKEEARTELMRLAKSHDMAVTAVKAL